ncbi:hypothetical protein SSX86_008572 [Deinandra increscens subsp. villosa]|uniref:Late embryogenesis abundant protein LEA-2 subgroup domain-containing protein n=1 Tax=Deinandra increscens subsp. villosa TaxID=3103831 RepID=A0AAP0DFH5_9ASTR
MEGRESSSSTGNLHPNHHIKPNSDDEDELFEDLLDSRDDETYVIQVPKDQIYRVPPPENAIFADQKRAAAAPKANRSNRVLVSVLVLLLLIAFILGICLAVADKADPTFRIHRIHVTTRGAKGKESRQHEFDVTLRSKNTNDHTVIAFQKGGKALLWFRHRSLAKCRFPVSEQGTDSLEYMKLKLVSGSEKALPKVIRKSMNGTSNTSIKLSLGFNVPLRFKVGVFPVKSKRLSIVCNVKVKRLTNRARILTQDCDYSATN